MFAKAVTRRAHNQCIYKHLGPRRLHNHAPLAEKARDPRIQSLGHVIEDEFAVVRSTYQTPKHPIILAHGLLGFDELHLVSKSLPGIRYWYGITEALAAKGIEVITAAVPPSGRIEVRAEKLAETIFKKAQGKAVNIIA
jgi:triacylglycerol lipase